MDRIVRKFDKITIHIGTEKTGTSAIQHFLRDNERSIEKDGVYYPKSTGPSYGSQWSLVALVKENPWEFDIGRSLGIRDADAYAKFKENFSHALYREFSRVRRAKHLAISSEHFHSRLTTAAELVRLRNILEPWTDHFQIVVFFRRQDRVAVSFHSTRVKSGMHKQGPCFPVGHNPLPRYYCYDKIFELWAEVFGAENVSAHLYEEAEAGDGVVHEFCRTLDIPIEGKDLPRRVNKSLSREGFQFLSALNKHPELVAKMQKDENRAEINKELTELFPGKYYPVSRQEAISFYAQFEASNARLKKMAFPDRIKPLFDDDFSDYPEVADNTPPSYEEAVFVGIELWRRARSRKQFETIGRAIQRKLRIK